MVRSRQMVLAPLPSNSTLITRSRAAEMNVSPVTWRRSSKQLPMVFIYQILLICVDWVAGQVWLTRRSAQCLRSRCQGSVVTTQCAKKDLCPADGRSAEGSPESVGSALPSTSGCRPTPCAQSPSTAQPAPPHDWSHPDPDSAE